MTDDKDIAIETGSSQLLYTLRDRVAIITLNRPDARNALSGELTPALRRTIAACAEDPRVGALLITGAGQAFCAGGDVKGMSIGIGGEKLSTKERVDDLQIKQRALTGALVALRKPTIAALPGAAAGAGLAIALACDIRIAAVSAFVSTAYVKVGLSGDYGISVLLTRAVGAARARELMLTSERVDSARCEQIGIFSRLVPDAQLQDAAFTLAKTLANRSADALRAIKDNLDEALKLDLATSMDREAERLIACGATADHAEAVRAFVEKRPAVFRR